MPSITWNHLIRVSLAAVICGSGVCASAQVQPRTKSDELITPKVELFGGYSYFDPGTALHAIQPGGTLPFSECLCSIPRGAGASATYNFTPWLGLTLDGSGNWSPHQPTLAASINKSAFYSGAMGPTFTLRRRHFSPFVEGLVGWQRLTPKLLNQDDSFGFLAGGGLDWNLGRHFAIRVARADFVYSNHQFGPTATVPATDIRGLRLESGLVFMFGGAAAVIPVHEAPPVAAVAVPMKTLTSFSITCSANPSVVSPGEASTISAHIVSPDNRPLMYSYISSAGSIAGGGSTATLVTTGAAPGDIAITCTGIDNAGQTATHHTVVTITAPAAVAKPMTSELCSITFDRDTARPARVNNEAKACLDEIALSLQQHADATLAIVGSAAGSGSNASALASQRAANTKAYLVTEKGVDPSRIDTFTGTEQRNVASSTLVPPGASFDAAGLTRVRNTPGRAHRPAGARSQ